MFKCSRKQRPMWKHFSSHLLYSSVCVSERERFFFFFLGVSVSLCARTHRAGPSRRPENFETGLWSRINARSDRVWIWFCSNRLNSGSGWNGSKTGLDDWTLVECLGRLQRERNLYKIYILKKDIYIVFETHSLSLCKYKCISSRLLRYYRQMLIDIFWLNQLTWFRNQYCVRIWRCGVEDDLRNVIEENSFFLFCKTRWTFSLLVLMVWAFNVWTLLLYVFSMLYLPR